MKLIDRLRAKSSERNRVIGQIHTVIGTICTVALTMGGFTNTYVLIGLTVGAILFGGMATKRALKIGKN